MKGLLLKDLKSLGGQAKTLGLLMLLYAGVSILSKNPSMFISMSSMFAAMLPITAMSYDEKAHWDGFALTMPLSRSALVISKYLLTLILIGFVLVLSPIVILISGSEITEMLRTDLITALIASSIALAYEAIILPILFKKGVEKGRVLMLVVLFVPVIAVLVLGSNLVALPEISDAAMYRFAALAPVAALALFALSACISCGIYAKREF